MKKLLGAMVMGALLALPASAAPSDTFNINAEVVGNGLNIAVSSGSLNFPAAFLSPTGDTLVTATAAPAFTVSDTTGTGAGWHVDMQASDLANGTGGLIGANRVRVAQTGGTANLSVVTGDPLSAVNGPTETVISTNGLNVARRVLFANPNFGKGTYTWAPAASAFSLNIPSTAPAGVYTGTGTVTILTGP